MLQRVGEDWVQAIVAKVEPACADVVKSYRVENRLVIHKRSVHIGARAVAAAINHSRIWGAGMAAPTVPAKEERFLIPPATAEHFQRWVFRFDFIEVLKMTSRNIEGYSTPSTHAHIHVYAPPTPHRHTHARAPTCEPRVICRRTLLRGEGSGGVHIPSLPT